MLALEPLDHRSLIMDWQQYEREIEEQFRENYPSARITRDAKLAGKFSKTDRQIDLCRDDVNLIIGEAKSGHSLNADEKDKLSALVKKTGAIAAFCTQNPQFSDEDKLFFRKLIEEKHSLILLTSRHLEMDYLSISKYKSGRYSMLSYAELLSRLSTIEVLGEEFADKHRIWI